MRNWEYGYLALSSIFLVTVPVCPHSHLHTQITPRNYLRRLKRHASINGLVEKPMGHFFKLMIDTEGPSSLQVEVLLGRWSRVYT